MKFIYLSLFFFSSFTQFTNANTPADSIPVEIIVSRSGVNAHFKAELPELKGVPGGRQAFYTYLWDFGDGHFSTQESPRHIYKKPGDYAVNLYVVNNYDDGPRPKRRAKEVSIASTSSVISQTSLDEQNFFASNGVFQLSKNANALPGQDMVIVAGVKNTGKGRIFLLTNEKVYGNEGLQYVGQSNYNNEKIVPIYLSPNLNELWASVSNVTVTQSGSPDYGVKEERSFQSNEAIEYFTDLYESYKTITSYEIDNNTGDAQFSFVNLDVTAEMLADTNAIVTITGIYLPDQGDAVIHKLEVPVVTSHDPNKMSLKQSRLSYRTISKKKELIYKVQFQNDGEGDAKNVVLEIALPKSVDPTTFKLLNLYPQCDTCLTESQRGCWNQYIKGPDTLVFHFKDISLPGTKAEDIIDQDSTKGFIRFSVQTRKKLKNKAFKARTNIYFDKNDPIKTNSVTGRFRKGFSPMVFAGSSTFVSAPSYKDGNFKALGMFGVGLAPLAPYKKLYWQLELYVNPSRYQEQVLDIKNTGKETILVDLPDAQGTIVPREQYFLSYDKKMESTDLYTRFVPLHIRYNFNSFLSAGVGALTEFRINLNSKENHTYYLENADLGNIFVNKGKWDELGNKMKVKTFLDLTVGRVYLGPSLGMRYVYGGNQGQQLNFYAAWRL